MAAAKAFVIPSIFQAIDKLSPTFKIMGKSADVFTAKLERISNVSKKISIQSGVAAAAIAAPLVIAGKAAVDFEDKLADVAKTTGLKDAALDAYGQSLLDLSLTTRTSIDELLKIGEIGGQLGIAEKDLMSFTVATNKFNVALGGDFAGGVEEASSSIGKIKSLFKETRDLNISDAINKTGSAINELGADGNATSANITDFTLRIGALPDAIKPSLQNTQALGALFEEAGLASEIAARGFGDLALTAAKNLPLFAKQMNISEAAAKKLIETDPTKFTSDFAASLNKLSGTELAKKLTQLKIGDTGTIKVVGALSTGIKRLTELQTLSAQAFKDGTSLTSEYDKKNATTAAQLKIAENNFQTLSITIGTQLLPVINSVIEFIRPVISSIIKFARENPKLVKTILIVTAALAALLGVISLVSGIIALVTAPFAGIIAAIVGLIVVIADIIAYWNDWGAAVVSFFALFFPPIGLMILLIQSIRNEWDTIITAFSSGDILAGITAIGAALMDVVLYPLQQILEIIASITGFDWAADAAKGVEAFRKASGVNVTAENSADADTSKDAVNPKAEEQNSMTQRMESVQKSQVEIGINAPKGTAEVKKNSAGIPVKLTSTQSYEQ